jgi:segregation and condensation protein B
VEERDNDEPKDDEREQGASRGANAKESEAASTAGEAGEIAPELEEAPALSAEDVRAVVEALVFASPQPLTPRELGKVLPGVPKETWQGAIEELKADYGRSGRGLQLVEVAGGFQITTRPELNEYVRDLLDPRSAGRLSIQALETLAVIAYKQPVTFPEIIELRGVKSGGVIKTLLEKRLIKITGRKEVVGRPMLYGTTKEFLLHFGLKDLGDLPKIEEFADVLGEEVDIAGLKRAIEAPRPVEIPLTEEEAAQTELPLDGAAESSGEPDPESVPPKNEP